MTTAVLGFTSLTLVSLVITLYADKRGDLRLRRIGKPLASTGFLGVGVAAGALDSAFGVAIFVGLCLGFVGDVMLMWRDRRCFTIGLFAFLLGHIAYCVAFAIRGVDLTWLVAVGGVFLILDGVLLRWLWPHVERPLRGPVIAYIVVISAMVALAAGSVAIQSAPLLLLGAVLFCLSDVSVARDRFLHAGFGNVLWGLTAYYVGQLLLAYSAGG